MAGALGAGVMLAADVVVSRFYGWRLADHLLLLALPMAGGCVLGLVIHARLMKLNRRAHLAERTQIDQDEDADDPPSRLRIVGCSEPRGPARMDRAG